MSVVEEPSLVTAVTKGTVSSGPCLCESYCPETHCSGSGDLVLVEDDVALLSFTPSCAIGVLELPCHPLALANAPSEF